MLGTFALGTLVTTLGVNTAPLMTAQGKVKAFATNTSTLMASVRRQLLSVFTVYQGTKLAKGFLDAARAAEDYKVSLNAVIKSASETEKVFEELYRWSASNPVDTDDAIAAFVRMKTAGIENARAAVNAIADVATVFHRPMEYVASSIVSTNNKMLRQLGITLVRTGKKAILTSGNIRVETTKDIEAVRKAIIEVFEKAFAGSMKLAENTWTGAMNTMRGQWWTFKADVMGSATSGGPFSLLVQEIVRLKDAWNEWSEGGMANPEYAKTIESFQTVFSAAIKGIITGMELFVKTIAWVVEHIELLTTALFIFAGAKGIGLATKALAFFRAELALGGAATTIFMRFIYKLRFELSLATGVIGKLKAAIIALGITPGGAVIAAIGGLLLLAQNLERPFHVSLMAIREARKEIDKFPMDKIKEIVDAAHSLGGMGLGGSLWASTRLAEENIKKLQDAKESESEYWARMRQKEWARKPVLPSTGEEGSSSGSGKSYYEIQIEKMKDQAKYLGANVQNFLPILDAWAAKMKPLSEDWKLIKDYSMEIREGLAKTAGEKAEQDLKRLEEQKKLIEETKEAAEQGVEKFWSTASTGFSQGLIKGEEYFQMLRNEFEKLKESVNKNAGGFLNMEDMFNWSDKMLARFSELQSVGHDLASLDLSNLSSQLDRGVVTKKEWVKQVELLIQKYGELPLVVEMLRKELEKTTDTSKQFNFSLLETIESFGEGMVDALASSIAYGEDLGDTMRRLAQDIAYAALKAILLQSILGIFGGGKIGGGLSGVGAGINIGKSVTGGSIATGTTIAQNTNPTVVMPSMRNVVSAQNVDSDKGGPTNITVHINAIEPQSFAQAMRSNKAVVESVVVENILKNGAVRSAIRGSV